ncbi:hypothetical protein SCANM63S_00100 [Streptomyces canarius]
MTITAGTSVGARTELEAPPRHTRTPRPAAAPGRGDVGGRVILVRRCVWLGRPWPTYCSAPPLLGRRVRAAAPSARVHGRTRHRRGRPAHHRRGGSERQSGTTSVGGTPRAPPAAPVSTSPERHGRPGRQHGAVQRRRRKGASAGAVREGGRLLRWRVTRPVRSAGPCRRRPCRRPQGRPVRREDGGEPDRRLRRVSGADRPCSEQNGHPGVPWSLTRGQDSPPGVNAFHEVRGSIGVAVMSTAVATGHEWGAIGDFPGAFPLSSRGRDGRAGRPGCVAGLRSNLPALGTGSDPACARARRAVRGRTAVSLPRASGTTP